MRLLKHPLSIYKRIFRIWQRTGEIPFRHDTDGLPIVKCSSCGHEFGTPFCPRCGQPYKSSASFFKGSFDNIPFLNDDAKRTFIHLLFRPGYMIMDYLKGKNSRYMAPLTALIIFYAFFALASSIISPQLPGDQKDKEFLEQANGNLTFTTGDSKTDSLDVSHPINVIRDVYLLTCLDRHPEYVDTPAKASLAAFESSLRSQGVFLFLWKLVLLTISIWMVFGIGRNRRLGFSASATVSAYMLCQFCFFMLILLFCTWGRQSKVGLLLMMAIMTVDLRQLFGFGTWKSLRKIMAMGLASFTILIVLVCFAIVFLVLKFGVI